MSHRPRDHAARRGAGCRAQVSADSVHPGRCPGATQAFTPTDVAGVPLGPTVERRSTWLELQGHASQAADTTTCDEATLELAWGPEPCWRYVVTEPAGETRFWFAQRLPGMPVVVESWEHDRLDGPDRNAGLIHGRFGLGSAYTRGDQGMAGFTPFTNNYRDLSDENGYQFEFVCDICGSGYRSEFSAVRHSGARAPC